MIHHILIEIILTRMKVKRTTTYNNKSTTKLPILITFFHLKFQRKKTCKILQAAFEK